MIQLQKYRSLSDTATELAAVLEKVQPADPLAGQTIIVPNMDTARWLKLELAEIRGVSANLRMILPSDWQYRQIRRLYPDLPKKLPSDILPMTWSLFELLSDEKAGKEVPILSDYIRRQSSASRETAIWQLSSQIASVLDQYLVYRPELLLSWQKGKTGKSTDEQWQAKLWNQLNSRWKEHSDPIFHKNRAELYRDLIDAYKNGKIECDEPLFVFNPGLIPAPILHSIKSFSQHQDVLFTYTSPVRIQGLKSEFNPMDTPRAPSPTSLSGTGIIRGELLDSFGQEALDLEQLYREHFGEVELIESVEPFGQSKSTGKGEPTDQVEPEEQDRSAEQTGLDVLGDQDMQGDQEGLVENAGQDGPAEQDSQMEQAGQVEQGHQVGPGGQMNFTAGLDDSTSNQQREMSNLKRIQASVLKDEPVRPGGTVDGSIRIHSCHSPLREIETLYHSLLEMFEQDETLNPDDVLVATPDPELYEPFIKAVFGTTEEGLPEIPWHLGSNGGRENVVEKSMRLWLELPDSRFRFQHVMDLFSMQPVRDAAGISESDVNEVRQWMTENSVMWGLDAKHREELGQPPSGAQTWYSAVKRGWLGQWMADEPGQFYEDTLLFAGIRTSAQKEAWAAFSQYLNRQDRAHQEAKESRTGREWCDWIEQRLEGLIGPETLMEQDGSTVRNALDLIRESCEAVENQKRVSFSMIRSVIISLLDQKGSAGALFTRGVTFSSMVPVRSIPFRVIALIGLNESTFPRKETVFDFDLMAQHPKPGERNRKHEDRNLFLESVLTASDIHYLSYVGQSPVDNEKIPPSTIVTEWIDLVSAVIGSERDEVVQKEALHLFSESYFREQRIYSELAHRTATNLKKADKTTSGLILDLKKEPEDQSTSDQILDLKSEPDDEWMKEPEDERVKESEDEWVKESEDELGKEPDDEWGKETEDEWGKETEDEWEKEITLDRFIRFFKNPVRAYVTDQLGASLRNPDEERDEFSLSHLERHLLFQKMMGWLIDGESESNILLLIRKAGLVPDGWAGESLMTELLRHCKKALEALEGRGVEPRFTELNIDLQIDEVRFLESILSYRDHSLIDIESSSPSGALLIQSWIRHLVWQASSGEKTGSNLLCKLKKGEPKWISYEPVEQPEKSLKKLFSLYQTGQSEPLLFFPKSLYAFKEFEEKGKSEFECLQQAASAFEGNDFNPFGERNDLSIQLLLGPETAFDPAWLKDEFLAVMSEMFEHLEVS